MKKTQLVQKSALILSASLLLLSCVENLEAPLIQEEANRLEILDSPNNGEENLRKAADRNYSERFQNSLFMIPGPGYVEGRPDNAFYPGKGVGNSTHMGKSLTFINQLTQFGPNGLETIAAPVTTIFGDELAAIGLKNIPLEVSSITTDGKGNSVWFKSISNQVVFNATGTRADFKAVVEIIGGTGKFENASGSGDVVGFFNPSNGKGSSEIKGRIRY